jgi:hypothetical protein
MERLERWEKFKAFLQKKGVLDEYMKVTIFSFPEDEYEDPRDWISGAFTWAAHGGTEIWEPLNNEWIKICDDER